MFTFGLIIGVRGGRLSLVVFVGVLCLELGRRSFKRKRIEMFLEEGVLSRVKYSLFML